MSRQNNARNYIIAAGGGFLYVTFVLLLFRVCPCTIWGWAMIFLGVPLIIIIGHALNKVGKKISKKELNELRDISILRILVLFPLMLIFLGAITLAIISYGDFIGDFIGTHFCEW
jgi:hypothetical protein